MSDTFLHGVFGRDRLDDRQVSELVGLAHGVIADGNVSQAEVEYLLKWLATREQLTQHPLVIRLADRVRNVLRDGFLDESEALDLFAALSAFAGGDFEEGELTKSTTLPLCDPPPTIDFFDRLFCFTGTFAFGSRKECEAAVTNRGAIPGPLTSKTKYLVIGLYATDSWAQSAFGRKIEKAVEMRSEGKKIAIIGEEHWVKALAS